MSRGEGRDDGEPISLMFALAPLTAPEAMAQCVVTAALAKPAQGSSARRLHVTREVVSAGSGWAAGNSNSGACACNS
eukprot:2108027-Prymnesium_polylepis.1